MENMTIGEIYCQYKDSIVYVEQINGFGNPYNVSVLLGLKSDSTYYIGLNIRYTKEELEQSINKEWYDDIYPLGNLLFRIPDNIYIRNKNRKPDNKIIKFR